MRTKGSIAVDGASKGNPGPAGIGVVIFDESGKVLKEVGEAIGKATNNFAEYTALIRGLSEALHMGFTDVKVQTDSELMARQISGQYKVKTESIIPLYESVLGLLGKFKTASVTHVRRDKNKLADKLASDAAVGRTAEEKPAKEGKRKAEPSEKPRKPQKPEKAAPVQQSLMLEEAAPEGPARREATMMQKLPVRTSARTQFVDITSEVQRIVRESGVSEGVCTVFVPHTTAGITINENADPDVTRDIIDTLNRLVPQNAGYRHVEGNADSHVKASMMGFSVDVLVDGGRLILGTWQAIYFCEFDGPRNRQVYVRVG